MTRGELQLVLLFDLLFFASALFLRFVSLRPARPAKKTMSPSIRRYPRPPLQLEGTAR